MKKNVELLNQELKQDLIWLMGFHVKCFPRITQPEMKIALEISGLSSGNILEYLK